MRRNDLLKSNIRDLQIAFWFHVFVSIKKKK